MTFSLKAGSSSDRRIAILFIMDKKLNRNFKEKIL